MQTPVPIPISTPIQDGDIVVLNNGRIVTISGPRRVATFVTCDWLVAVPTASLYPPEAEWYPDSPSDVYTEVACGARLRSLDNTLDHTTCDNGHERHPYGSPESERANLGAEYDALMDESPAEARRFALDVGLVR